MMASQEKRYLVTVAGRGERSYYGTGEVESFEAALVGRFGGEGAVVTGGDLVGFRVSVGGYREAWGALSGAVNALRAAGREGLGEELYVEEAEVCDGDTPGCGERDSLVGLKEAAGILGEKRQYIGELRVAREAGKRLDFPATAFDLACGPIWRRGDIERFGRGRSQIPGPRPTSGPDLRAARIGGNIRRIRKRRDLDQRALAAASGVSVKTISFLERGERSSPKESTLEKIASALGVSAEELGAGSVEGVSKVG